MFILTKIGPEWYF